MSIMVAKSLITDLFVQLLVQADQQKKHRTENSPVASEFPS